MDVFEKFLRVPQREAVLGTLFVLRTCTTSELARALFAEGVMPKMGAWNISSICSKNPKFIVRKNGTHWKLKEDGSKFVSQKFGLDKKQLEISAEIRTVLAALDEKSPNYDYALEFAGCFDNGYYRSSLVMAWSGAVWPLRGLIVNDYLDAFNAEAAKDHARWKSVVNPEGFENQKDITLIKYGRAAGALPKSLATRLEAILNARNNCGHPSGAKIGDIEILGHIEFMVMNVYQKYQ
jgi:hypothetical protein